MSRVVAVTWVLFSLALVSRIGGESVLHSLPLTPLAEPALDRPSDYAAIIDDEALIQWASRVRHRAARPRAKAHWHDVSSFLIIGVKTSVLHHFPQRQAIRETWAQGSRLQSLGVRVVFLGCETDLSPITDAEERANLEAAIALEKEVYSDLLTRELECVDSYAQLLRKTVNFFHWVVTFHRDVRFVMVADDDVYVDVARLVAKLRHEAPEQRFYGGYVFHGLKPQRSPGHKNAIPEHDYPMATLPPFVGGPHYVMSMDVVNYVARNRDVLRGLRALDDVSIALWLLAIQVHTVHISEFVLLRTSPCRDEAIAIADLSPASVRHLHSNSIHGRGLCDALDSATAIRRQRGITLPDEGGATSNTSDTKLTWEMYHNTTSSAIHIGVTISVASHQVFYTFVPSSSTYESGLCLSGADLLFSQLYVAVGTAFCQYHRRKLLALMDETVDTDHNMRAMLTLPRHNLLTSANAVILIGISRGARYARILIECLLVAMYPKSRILLLDEHTLDMHENEVRPDLFIFSILPEDSDDNLPDGARFFTKYGEDTPMLMIAGETWLPKQLDPRVTLLTTVANSHHPKQIYLPVASTIFGEMMQHTPVELLQSYADRIGTNGSRRFCAYLYARCDRLRREYMFDLLNDIEPVDALGACQGTKRHPRPHRGAERYEEAFYTDLAITKYTNYKFAIAFENSVAPGYVTEKIVTAFLAGAVPIYFGHSPTVNRLFNRDAFINCADFDSLRACAQRVVDVNASPSEYESLRRAAPITNRTAFLETFSWHPEVADLIPREISRITSKQLEGKIALISKNAGT